MNPFDNTLDKFLTNDLGIAYSKDDMLYHYTGVGMVRLVLIGDAITEPYGFGKHQLDEMLGATEVA